MTVNRVTTSDLILTFIPADDQSRGLTEDQIDKLCLNITKQACDLLEISYSATGECLIDTAAGFAIIQAICSRIANHLYLWHRGKVGYPPKMIIDDSRENNEAARVTALDGLELSFIDGYDD